MAEETQEIKEEQTLSQSNEEAIKYQSLYEERRKKRLEIRESLSKENLSLFRLTFEDLRLKADLKTITKYLKKVASFSQDDYSSLVEQLDQLNLNRFQSELQQSLLECLNDGKKINSTDLFSLALFIIEIHKRYPEFITSFEISLSKSMTENDKEKCKRFSFLLYCELFLFTLFPMSLSWNKIYKYIENLCNNDNKDRFSDDYKYQTISLFMKLYGYEYIGCLSRTNRNNLKEANIQLVSYALIPPEKQNNLNTFIEDYYHHIEQESQITYKNVMYLRKEKRKQEALKGQIPADIIASSNTAEDSFSTLSSRVTVLSDLCNQPVPEWKEEVTQSQMEVKDISVWTDEEGAPLEYTGPFNDIQEHRFYLNVFDIKPFIPTRGQKKEVPKEQNETNATTSNPVGPPIMKIKDIRAKRGNLDSALSQFDVKTSTSVANITINNNNNNNNNNKELVVPAPSSSVSPSVSSDISFICKVKGEDTTEEDTIEINIDDIKREQRRVEFENKLKELDNCIIADEIDKWCIDFCLMNTVSNRDALYNYIITECRNSRERQPLLVRLLKVLQPATPQLPGLVFTNAQSRFYGLRYSQDPTVIPVRIANAYFLTEFARFSLIPPSTTFSFINSLLEKMNSGNIQVLSILIERIGPYFLCLPEVNEIMKKILDQIQRIIKSFSLDSELNSVLQSAFYACYPQLKPKLQVIEIPPKQQYIQYLLYERLPICKTDEELSYIATQFQKFNFEDISEILYIIDEMLEFPQKCYIHVSNLSVVLAEICFYKHEFRMFLLDSLFEKIRFTLDVLPPNTLQNTVGLIQLISELFMYQVLTCAHIYYLLYLFIEHGHNVTTEIQKKYTFLPQRPMIIHPLVPCVVDPPYDSFRVNLVLDLLEACGKQLNPKTLVLFFKYFQRYVLSKYIVSIETLNKYETCLQLYKVRPKYKSYQEADDAIELIEKKELSKFGKLESHIFIIEEEAENTEEELNNLVEDSNNTTTMNEEDEKKKKESEAELQFNKEFDELFNPPPISLQIKKQVNLENMSIPIALTKVETDGNSIRFLTHNNKKKVVVNNLNVDPTVFFANSSEAIEKKKQERQKLKEITIENNKLFSETQLPEIESIHNKRYLPPPSAHIKTNKDKS
ncbi:hypothetical protein WA158_007586 [Blastocystis sp. Blastoise]